MIYWTIDAETGRKLYGCRSYKEALTQQNKLWVESHIDTGIMKEE